MSSSTTIDLLLRQQRSRSNNQAVMGTSDDDIYAGYNDYPQLALATEDLENDFGLSSRHTTGLSSSSRSRGRTPASGKSFLQSQSRLGTSAGFTRQSTARTRNGTARPITGHLIDDGGVNRPMTAVRGAGYTGAGGPSGGRNLFDKAQGPKIILDPKHEDTPEEKIKLLESKINELVEESMKCGKIDKKRALELAKEASNKEKSLLRLKEQAGTKETHDWDISFLVQFNLGCQYEGNEMWTEALSTYQAITRNKQMAGGPKVKINMGNIHWIQGHPQKAIKMYRMAMDQLNNTNKDLRLKLMHNMGIIFLRMGLFNDASDSFEYIMQEKPNFKTGLHLVVSNCLGGSSEKMKRSFQDLLEVPIDFDDDEDKYTSISDDPVSQLLVEVLKNDKLRKLEKERKLYAERCILSCARLIAPTIELTLSDGYHWVTEAIKSSRHAYLAHALEISKAIVFLKQRELSEAIEILKSFEKKESSVATSAATNLSFLFFLQGDLEQAEKYGEIAKNADFYNSSAYVNLGNCKYTKGDFEGAKKYFMEAIENDSSCIEALFNMGLCNQQLKYFEEALECFHKVQSLVKNHPHVTYQIGRTHELMGENEMAGEWILKTLALVPSDPGVLKKLGSLAELDGDKQQAYQYFYDCYRSDASDLEVIEWLALYLKELQVPDKAIQFYVRASLQQPEEPRWPLLIANCHLQSGNYSQALTVFQKVHKEHPDNIQALSGLSRLSSDMGLKEAEKYMDELRKLERLNSERYSSARSSGSRAQGQRLGSSHVRAGAGFSAFPEENERMSETGVFASRISLQSSSMDLRAQLDHPDVDSDDMDIFRGSLNNHYPSNSSGLNRIDESSEFSTGSNNGRGRSGHQRRPSGSVKSSSNLGSSGGSKNKRVESPTAGSGFGKNEEIEDFWAQGENEIDENHEDFLPF